MQGQGRDREVQRLTITRTPQPPNPPPTHPARLEPRPVPVEIKERKKKPKVGLKGGCKVFSAVPFVQPKYLSLSVFHTPAHLHSCTQNVSLPFLQNSLKWGKNRLLDCRSLALRIPFWFPPCSALPSHLVTLLPNLPHFSFFSGHCLHYPTVIPLSPCFFIVIPITWLSRLPLGLASLLWYSFLQLALLLLWSVFTTIIHNNPDTHKFNTPTQQSRKVFPGTFNSY